MLREGATFLDIGGYSSRPGAEEISEDEELKRVLPAIEIILKNFPEALLSIDTFRSKVASESVKAGACIVNDISAGGLDKKMMQVIAEAGVPYIMMHMRGTPQTMKDLTEYEDLIQEVIFYFSEKVEAARKLGINDLIIDPGFGFSKNHTSRTLSSSRNYSSLKSWSCHCWSAFPVNLQFIKLLILLPPKL